MNAITKEQVELAERYLATLEKIKALENEKASEPRATPLMVSVAPVEAPEPVPVHVFVKTIPSARTASQPRTAKWTLKEDDLTPGIIAWFDSNTLNTDPHVAKPQQFDNYVNDAKTGRPHVCIAVDDDVSTWASLSRQQRDEYLKLDSLWILPRGALTGTSFVTGHVYSGPNESFCIAAAQAEFDFTALRRPKLRAVGLEAVQEFCEGKELVTR